MDFKEQPNMHSLIANTIFACFVMRIMMGNIATTNEWCLGKMIMKTSPKSKEWKKERLIVNMLV